MRRGIQKPGLVFTLKEGQRFYIGNPQAGCILARPVWVTIESITKTGVKIRADADKTVPVNREGIFKNVPRPPDRDDRCNPDHLEK